MVSSLPSQTFSVNLESSGIDSMNAAQNTTNDNLVSLNSKMDRAGNACCQKSSNSIVQAFNAYSGRCIVTKINGFSITPLDTNYMQIFDGVVPTGFPVASFIVESGNNFFYTFEGGVIFDNGITIASSNSPFTNVSGAKDFYVSVFYKPYPN